MPVQLADGSLAHYRGGRVCKYDDTHELVFICHAGAGFGLPACKIFIKQVQEASYHARKAAGRPCAELLDITGAAPGRRPIRGRRLYWELNGQFSVALGELRAWH